MRIALVTDSTSDLTEDMKRSFDVRVMPLTINFGGEILEDGELSPVEFYLRLMRAKVHPVSAPPSPEKFISLYREVLETADQVISIHLSAELSQTVVSARRARDFLGAADRIHVIDSKTVSMGTALQVAEAAKGIRSGLIPDQIVESLGRVRNNTETIFTLDTLTFLQKGGRIGRLAGMIGMFMNIKPVLQVSKDGVLESAGKARSQEQAIAQIVTTLKDKAMGRRVVAMGIIHGSARQAGRNLKTALEGTFGITETYFNEVGPVLGVHAGPGAVGAAVRFE